MSERLKYSHLLNLEYRANSQDCWSCTRNFYHDNAANLVRPGVDPKVLDFPDYSRPHGWWNQGLNLYRDLLFDIGFQVVHDHPMHWRPSDLIVMQIQAGVWNHSAVLVDGSRIVHHFFNRRSVVEPYRGLWRQTTVAVLRHKDVEYVPPLVLSDIKNHIPPRAGRPAP